MMYVTQRNTTVADYAMMRRLASICAPMAVIAFGDEMP